VAFFVRCQPQSKLSNKKDAARKGDAVQRLAHLLIDMNARLENYENSSN
jgi:hypothetical protein